LQVIQFMTLMGAGVRRHPPVAARSLCRVKRTWLCDQQQGQAKQAGPKAWSRSRLPTGQTLAVLIVRWIRCALRSRTFGTPPARVHSGENVCSINLRQSTMIISFRPSAFQLERSQGAERLLLTAAKKSLKDRESTRHASVRIIKHLIFEDQTGGGTEWFP